MKTEVLLSYVGNLGNVLLQLFLVDRLKDHLGEVSICANHPKVVAVLNELQVSFTSPTSAPEARFRVRKRIASIEVLIAAFNESGLPAIDVATCNIDLSQWPRRSQLRRDYLSRFPVGYRVDDKQVLINVRGGRVLQGIHKDYVPLPASFYRRVIDESGLDPVFFGQIYDDAYSDYLRSSFPGAHFVSSRSPMEDFDTVASAAHIVNCVSTFSFLAGWLSRAREIHLPLLGIFNPFQRSDIAMCPDADDRYTLYQFPFFHMEPISSMLEEIEQRLGGWRRVTHKQHQAAVAGWPYFKLPFEQAMAVFDPQWYRSVVPLEELDHLATDRDYAKHFRKKGYPRNMAACAVDSEKYLKHIDAARAVGFGEYRNAYEHYTMVGRLTGLKPV